MTDRNQQGQTVHPGYHMMKPDLTEEEDSEHDKQCYMNIVFVRCIVVKQ